jgi:hypothetical protein
MNKKTGAFGTGFLVVAKVIEPLARRSQISNLDLWKDLGEVIGFINVHETESCEITHKNKNEV